MRWNGMYISGLALVLALCVLHVFNFRRLRGWPARAWRMSPLHGLSKRRRTLPPRDRKRLSAVPHPRS